VTSFRQARYSHLQSELEAAESYEPVDPWSYRFAATLAQLPDKPAGAVKGLSDLVWPTDARAVVNPDTGVERDVLVEVGKQSVSLPDGFVGTFV
jgi:probable 2-oxoglutarate dehydrogenase E1 component DHKTD1